MTFGRKAVSSSRSPCQRRPTLSAAAGRPPLPLGWDKPADKKAGVLPEANLKEPEDFDPRRVIALTIGFPEPWLLSLTVPGAGILLCGPLTAAMLDRFRPRQRLIAAQFSEAVQAWDLLNRQAQAVTQEARALGILPGMTGREILAILFQHQEDLAGLGPKAAAPASKPETDNRS